MNRATLVRGISLVSTVVLCWGALSFGRSASAGAFNEGDLARRAYYAARDENVEDPAATQAARDAAAAEVPIQYRRLGETEQLISNNIAQLFTSLESAILAATPTGIAAIPEPEPPAVTTDESTVTTAAEEPTATLTGRVFFDVDDDGIFEETESDAYRNDFGVGGIGVAAIADGVVVRATTASDGTYSLEVPPVTLTIVLDSTGGVPPSGVIPRDDTREVDCRRTAECQSESLVLKADFRIIDDVVADVSQSNQMDDPESLSTLVTLARRDFVSGLAGAGENLLLDQVEFSIETWLGGEFNIGIRQEDLLAKKDSLSLNPPLIQPGFPADLRDAARTAAAGVIDNYLVHNLIPNDQATEAAKEAAAAEVDPIMVPVRRGQLIVDQGMELNAFHIEAIQATGAAEGDAIPELALAAVLTVLVAVLGYYLARFRAQFWERPKMVTLFGILLVMGALAVRGALAMEARDFTVYALPAVAFGYLAAVLFDNRMGTLMALAMAVLTAAGTQQTGITVYALLATLAPIGFVSSASSRHAYRNSVVVSAVAASLIAASTAWLFYTDPDISPWSEVLTAGVWGFGVSLAAALLIQPVLASLEVWFDITTTLRLLDVTDRNHDALQLLQEKAFGTFNHSLMVGTLADGAARQIGANNLLARAAAYYHDLGKTENALYFIENQFGISNPHDELSPEESADVIRRHVIDGLELARRYRIPTEVAEGILTHHGDGVMRYFYEKARSSRGGDVDIDDFRHAGHKPKSKEMAIVMMADSVEGACRAAFRDEDPSADVIAKVINRVVDEKLVDGQLSECDLTMGELTKVKAAFLDALVGHYHQRIAYPNFPGS